MNALTIQRFPPLGYAAAEAVNMLCTNLSFSGENVKRIMLTSCHEGEGKSFLSMNVMRTLARLGKTVALVDADLRKSRMAETYGLRFQAAEPRGLSHLLAGMAEESAVLYETDIPGACLVPVGRKVSNSLPLLNSPRFPVLLEHLAEQFDYVLVDAPPVGLVIDAAQIAQHCDGCVLVVGYNAVHRRELAAARDQIAQSGCPILGTVLNGAVYDRFLGGAYGYRAYSGYRPYGREENGKQKGT